jgi:hypothetical protein
MRLTGVRALLAAGVMTVAATVTALAGAGPAGAAPLRPSPPGDLYYVSGGYITQVPVAGGTPHRVVKIGNVSITGMAITDSRLFWVTLTGNHDSISFIRLQGAPHVRKLVRNLSFPVGLVTAGGWLYWADQHAIGRVRPSGTQLSRRFIRLPQERGGGVADGLATDGHHLFFSRCQDNEIGRVNASGRDLAMRFIRLPRHACPQALAVGNDHVYWAELGGHVGRATLRGTGASIKWLNIRTSQGPFNVAADNSHVYWDWGGVAGSPMHIGSARLSRAGFRRSIRTGQGAFLLTSPGAST